MAAKPRTTRLIPIRSRYFYAAAVLFIRYNPPAKKLLDKLAKAHGKGKAIGIIAHKLTRAIYCMLKNNMPFNLEKFMATA